jgi:putative ABC transport system substrate-binding protein
MKRRDFIALLGGATSWPFAAMAQQPAMPVVGFLTSRTAQQAEYLLPSLRAGLKESGYVEGQNVTSTIATRTIATTCLPDLPPSWSPARSR